MRLPTASASRLQRLLGYVERNADNLQLRKDAVREACDTGHWSIARELLCAGLRDHPADPELLALSGFVKLHAQLFTEAEQDLSAAVSHGATAAEVRYNLAFACFLQKRPADALEILKAPGVCDSLALAVVLRARCLHHLGDLEAAAKDCRAVLLEQPQDAQCKGLLSLILLDKGENGSALDHATAALALNPTQLEALLVTASLRYGARDYDGARTFYEALLRSHPECGRGWLGSGLVNLVHLQFERALHDLTHASVYMPEHIGTWHALAWIHIIRTDYPQARKALEQSLTIDRSFSETHGGLAVIAALQGRDEDAHASIKVALRLDRRSMSAQYAEMLLLQNYGQEEDARALLEGFLSRPASGGAMRYGDLVNAHFQMLRTRCLIPDSAVRH